MKIHISKNRKTFFFYLVLADFIIAIQIAAVSAFSLDTARFIEKWMSESFILSFSSALPIFLLFSGMFKNSKRLKSVIRPGLVLMILGSVASLLANTPGIFTFGRTVCGLGAGMLVAGQIGIIWHEEYGKIRRFSVAVLAAFMLGLIFGPRVVVFLAGSQLSALKLAYLLGIIAPVLVVIEIITEIFVATYNVTVDATGAFFDIDSSDDIDTRTRKVAAMTVRRAVYVFFDYWISIASAGLVGVLNYWGLVFWKIVLIAWIFNFIIAIAFVIASERSGHDITLGESFRRAADAIKSNSRMAGYLAYAYLCIKALIWDGPEQIVIFFKKEIGTMMHMAMVLIILTFIQGAFWAWVYGLGYESVGNLIKNFL